MKQSKPIEIEDELEEAEKITKDDLEKAREQARRADLLQLFEA